MVFSSVIFLFLYLPLVMLIYLALGRNVRNYFLLGASLLFYFWGENYLIWILLTTIVTDFTCGWLIAGEAGKRGEALQVGGERTRKQKLILVGSILINLSLLGYFKYYNFFLDNTLTFLTSMGWGSSGLFDFTRVALPLGISFYTFQSMSYTIDVYRGEVKATRRFWDYACYVTMFPQLVAGPIVRYRDLQDQLSNHEVSVDRFGLGVRRFTLGLAKKVLIANTVAMAADAVFGLPPEALTCGLAWIGVVCYTLQIYYDFSGYSDMAIGLGLMLGFRLPENFNYPYISRSVREFWRRWHISLSTWFRDYLYIPLGGNRGSKLRTCGNLLAVFLLCGLWHGASWTFVIWGLWHGGLMMLERLGVGKVLSRLPRVCGHLYLLAAVIIGWVVFRCESLPAAWHYLKALSGLGSAAVKTSPPLPMIAPVSIIVAMAVGAVLAAPLFPWFLARYRHWRDQGGWDCCRAGVIVAEGVGMAALLALLILSVLLVTAGSYNPFIYFRF